MADPLLDKLLDLPLSQLLLLIQRADRDRIQRLRQYYWHFPLKARELILSRLYHLFPYTRVKDGKLSAPEQRLLRPDGTVRVIAAVEVYVPAAGCYGDPPPPREPSNCDLPEDQVQVMMERLERGEGLWHPRDRVRFNGDKRRESHCARVITGRSANGEDDFRRFTTQVQVRKEPPSDRKPSDDDPLPHRPRRTGTA